MPNNGKLYESEYEEAMVMLLQQEGWQYTYGENLHRQMTDAIYEEDLRTFIKCRYANMGMDDSDVETAISKLKNVSGVNEYNSLRNAYMLYSDGYDFSPIDNKYPPFKFEYIDFEHPERNIFRVVNQWEMHQGKEIRIPDVLLLVNGIPVCIIELKNPTDKNATIRTAHTQITTRYVRDISNLLKYSAIACISDGSNTRLGTIFTPYEFFYAWKKVDNEDEVTKGIDELCSMVKGAMAPQRLLEILRDYIYFPDPVKDQDETLQVVCRYPQFFATRKLKANIIKHLKVKDNPCGDGKGGTYFGATGCGKTYTMLFLARQLMLRCKDTLGSPTILLIVDREDLETQTGKLFAKSKQFLVDQAVCVFDSRKTLAKEISNRKSGGCYITTIQKFCESMGLLSERSNIICLSDEAHRSQTNVGVNLKINNKQEVGKQGAYLSYGFAQYLRNALPNATYVAFSGTPVDDTIHVFGAEVDRYTMLQAQEDGITVPIKYDPRLARVVLDRDLLEQVEQYYEACAEESATQEDIEKSKRAMSSLNVILSDPDRLKRVASDIATDYENRCDNVPYRVQKAMITCSDRAIAFELYKKFKDIRPKWFEKKKTDHPEDFSEEELEKLNEVQFLEIVATRGKDDPKEMYDTLGDEEHRKFLDSEFKNDKSNFRIVIVVDMWITGFDCPSLTFLYNDKPLQKHTLIQTISRVNRKYKDKEHGFVIDYIGIRENMKKAMKRYGGDDTHTGSEVEIAYEAFKNELQLLKELMNEVDFKPFFGENPLVRLQFLQNACEYILSRTVESDDDDKKKKKPSFGTLFKGHVRRLKSSFIICQPAGKLSKDEEAWAQCFMGIQSFMSKITNTQYDVDSMNKAVEKMVREALTYSKVETILGVQDEEDIFGSDFIQELNDVKLPNTRFQLLVNMLEKAIREYKKTNLVKAQSFEMMLAQIVDDYNTRDKLTFANEVAEEAVNNINDVVAAKLAELANLFDLIKADRAEFKQLGITFEEKAFYDILTDLRDRKGFEYPDDKCITLAKDIKELIDNTSVYADWIHNDNLRNQLASQLTFLLYKSGYPPEWDEVVFEKVLEQVENYKRWQ